MNLIKLGSLDVLVDVRFGEITKRRVRIFGGVFIIPGLIVSVLTFSEHSLEMIFNDELRSDVVTSEGVRSVHVGVLACFTDHVVRGVLTVIYIKTNKFYLYYLREID